jgi:hypothetical protein
LTQTKLLASIKIPTTIRLSMNEAKMSQNKPDQLVGMVVPKSNGLTG